MPSNGPINPVRNILPAGPPAGPPAIAGLLAGPPAAGPARRPEGGTVRPDYAATEARYAPGQDIRQIMQALPGRADQALTYVESEIRRCRRNLDVVIRHEGEINSPEAVGHYRQAEADLAGRHDHYLAMRERIYRLAVDFDAALGQVIAEAGGDGGHGQGLSKDVEATASPPSPPPSTTKHGGGDADGLSQEAIARHASALFGIDATSILSKGKEAGQ